MVTFPHAQPTRCSVAVVIPYDKFPNFFVLIQTFCVNTTKIVLSNFELGPLTSLNPTLNPTLVSRSRMITLGQAW